MKKIKDKESNYFSS